MLKPARITFWPLSSVGVVSGGAALLLEAAPELTPGQIKLALQLTAWPIEGAGRVARFILGLAHKYGGRVFMEPALINSEPGLIVWIDGSPVVVAFETDGERVAKIFHILNPDKLGRLQTAAG